VKSPNNTSSNPSSRLYERDALKGHRKPSNRRGTGGRTFLAKDPRKTDKEVEDNQGKNTVNETRNVKEIKKGK